MTVSELPNEYLLEEEDEDDTPIPKPRQIEAEYQKAIKRIIERAKQRGRMRAREQVDKEATSQAQSRVLSPFMVKRNSEQPRISEILLSPVQHRVLKMAPFVAEPVSKAKEDDQSSSQDLLKLPGLMRTKQTVFDRFSEKQDLIREVQQLR